MKHVRIVTTILTLITGLTICGQLDAAQTHRGDGTLVYSAGSLVNSARAYALHGRSGTNLSEESYGERIPLTFSASGSMDLSPGVTVGNTFWDMQHNCSMGRMIETGPYGEYVGPTLVHFSWMYSPVVTFAQRSYAYNAFDAGTGLLVGPVFFPNPNLFYSGFVNIDVTPDNRGIVGGHSSASSSPGYQPQIHFDAGPGSEVFNWFVRVPNGVAGAVDGDVEWLVQPPEFLWPKFFMQYGTDTVLHVAAQSDCAADGQLRLVYFRCLNPETAPAWDPVPWLVDRCETVSHDITGVRFGDHVYLSWLATPPYDGDPNLSGSIPPAYAGTRLAQMDNDLYLQESLNQGLTWTPRLNVTAHPFGGAGYKPYSALSMLVDSDEHLHIVWVSRFWDADPLLDATFPGRKGVYWYTRLSHWSNNVPFIRTITDHRYGWQNCTPPPWAGHVDKPTISDCDDKLYCVYTQFNDIPNGMNNDCADWIPPFLWPWGGANGDLFVSVTEDDGLTWDEPRNLTNTKSPGCNPVIYLYDCENDYWASMSRLGRQVQVGENWSEAVIVDIDPEGYTDDWYLDIQYLDDLDAGTPLQRGPGGLGSVQWDPIKWFRVPCGEAIPNPHPNFDLQEPEGPKQPSPPRIEEPIHGGPGEEIDVPATIENTGNVSYQYMVAIEEDNGPAGWLSVSGFSGTVPSGLDNVESGTIQLNVGGIVYWTTTLEGRIIFTSNAPSSPDTIEVRFPVVEEYDQPFWDTVHTNCLSLIVSNHGNMGREGNGGIGGVNMDYLDAGECDPSAKIYLYDGSPVVGWLDNGSPKFFYTMWGSDYLDLTGFRPVAEGDEIRTKECLGAEFFQTGTFVTHDSSIGLTRAYMAPTTDCPWIIEYTKVVSYDGASHSGVIVGEAIDWDIPSDPLDGSVSTYYYRDVRHEYGDAESVNFGGMEVPYKLVYQQGYESALDDTSDCQQNTDRYGGNAFIEAYYNGTLQPVPYAGAVIDNDITQDTEGFQAQPLYDEMTAAGFRYTDSVSDLHTLMTFHNDLDLDADDEYEVVCVLVTIHEEALTSLTNEVSNATAWYNANGGIAMFADDDDNGKVDACEGCCEVMGDLDGDNLCNGMDVIYFVDWLWNGGPAPVCMDEADVDGIPGVGPMDLIYLVDYMWGGGPAPAPCP